MAPRRPAVEDLVQQIMASWRASGGEPDIAPSLLNLLSKLGFSIRHAAPIVFCVSPQNFIWRWPATFLASGLKRLLELQRVDAAWG